MDQETILNLSNITNEEEIDASDIFDIDELQDSKIEQNITLNNIRNFSSPAFENIYKFFQKKPLRDYQKQAIHNFTENNFRGVVNMFCGLGKTYVAYYLLAQIQPKITLAFFPTIQLLEQFQEEIVNISQIKTKVITNNNDVDLQNIPTPIVLLCTYSAAKNVQETAEKANFLILDECHNTWSPTRIFLNNIPTKTLKLTATVHKKEQKENIVFCYSYLKACSLEILQDYEIKVPTQTDIAGKEKGIRFQELMYAVLNSCKQHNKKRLIVFNRTIRDDVESAEKYSSSSEFLKCQQQIENAFDCNIHILSTKTKDLQKKNILDDFKNPQKTKLQVIFNCNSLKEGIDTKLCDAVLFMDNKISFNMIVQNIGRCVRRKNNNMPSHIYIPLTEFDQNEFSAIKNIRQNGKTDHNLYQAKKLLKTKFEKLLNITQVLKKISGITDENMLKKINFMEVYTDGAFDIIDLDNIKDSFIFQKNNWHIYLDEVEAFIVQNKRLPKNKTEENGTWVTTQKTTYAKGTMVKEYVEKWKQFTLKYKKEFDAQEKGVEYW